MPEYLTSSQKLEFDKLIKYVKKYNLSDLGREHLDNLTFSSDIDEIKYNLSLVTEMKMLIETDDYLPLEHLFDIRKSLQYSIIEDYSLPPEDLNKIALLLNTSVIIHKYFSRRIKLYPLLSSKIKLIYIDKILEYNIRKAIDEEGNIKDSASKELMTIRKQIIDKSQFVKRNLESLIKSVAGSDWVQEEIITTREGRMVIPVKIEHKNRIPGFIHSASASGATVYIEPTETLEINNEIRTLHFQEKREIENILKELTRQTRNTKDNILVNVQILGELDFIQAKAKYSVEVIGAEPVMRQNGSLKLLNAYHPILLQRHKREEVVPLNMEIPEEINTVIITGPNAGGKSVAMKTVGLLSLMAQSGCHIPASPESELRIFSDFFVDIGDEQSIENDLSSFSSHLNNLKIILERANSTSLVLLDEIGSGTDPVEGSSLAASILERLTQIKSFNIATTHHGTLKSFAFETQHIQNAAMEFNTDTLQPTYHFRLGVPGSSYAIEMAERLNLPGQIIIRAREFKGDESNQLENLINDLERKSQEMKSSLDSLNVEKDRLNSLNLIYQNKINSLEKEMKSIKSHALNEARDILENANAIIEKSVREIREKSADSQTIKKSKEEIKKIKEEFSNLLLDINAAPVLQEFQIGDKVRLKQSDAVCEILSKIDDNSYLVLSGGLKLKVSKFELQPATEIKYKSTSYPDSYGVDQEKVKREIDLRGMYGDEAVDAVDKFIDEAILSGLRQINIIHGKGKGLLRKKITDYLKTHSSVKSFRLGEWNEGGTGVTVVDLS